MATDVRVPTTGNAGEDAVIVEWNAGVGDDVAAGDVLLVIETAKSTVDIEAPAAGRLLEVRFASGDEVPEHAVVAVIGAPGEQVEPAPAAPVADATPAAAAAARTPATVAHDDVRHRASPRARILADRRGIALDGLLGSGPGGRIVVGDVLAAARTVPASSDAQGAGPAPTTPSEPEFDLVPVRGARRITAQRMMESLQGSAQVTLTRYAPADAMLAYAARLKKTAATRDIPRIGVNDLLLFATARVVARHPEANARFDEDGIRRYRRVDLGIAVDSGAALLVPVVRGADTMRVGELADAARVLIARARTGVLTPAEMAGGTFSVSNLGSLGVHFFTPVLNPPQACILGVGAAQRMHPEGPALLPLSLTFDHRALDGADAARLLADIAADLETVDTLAAY